MLLENLKLFFKQLNTKTEQKIARIMFSKSMKISTVESCTGGLISSRLTDIAGSSAFIRENYVTYSNNAKVKILGVSQETLDKYGAVSEQCAQEMAEGLFNKLYADGETCDVTLSTTGIAGPGGASENKNVGLMYVAVKTKYSLNVKKFELNPKYKRRTMKFLFSQKALEFLLENIKETPKFENVIKLEIPKQTEEQPQIDISEPEPELEPEIEMETGIEPELEQDIEIDSQEDGSDSTQQ